MKICLSHSGMLLDGLVGVEVIDLYVIPSTSADSVACGSIIGFLAAV